MYGGHFVPSGSACHWVHTVACAQGSVITCIVPMNGNPSFSNIQLANGIMIIKGTLIINSNFLAEREKTDRHAHLHRIHINTNSTFA